ncbi:MAG: hypothetical protein V7K21_19220 [Nostoc sp.]|uniref:hypothetical protein n=1 Tax=Nostoc sp. TaxID=1180 RepID=UPI002FFC65B8
MSAPVTLYSPDGKRSREIAAVDAPGWIRNGWSATPVVIPLICPEPPLVETLSPVVAVAEPTPKQAKRNDIPRNAIPEN